MTLEETLKANTVAADYQWNQPAWMKCDCCDDFLCTIHGDHAADCPCPPIDVWSLYGKSPYHDSYLWREVDLLPDPKGYPDLEWPELD